MKKVFLSIVTVVSIFMFWVIEPFNNNPFHTTEEPFISSSMQYDCMPENELKDLADSKLHEYMQLNQFLGINIGFSKSGCGTYTGSSGYTDKRNLLKVKSNTHQPHCVCNQTHDRCCCYAVI